MARRGQTRLYLSVIYCSPQVIRPSCRRIIEYTTAQGLSR